MSLKEKLASQEFVILAEMEPPKGVDVAGMMANAMRVKGKVDAFVVPEMSNAVMRMSSLGGCMVLATKGFETILQTCCRDRNRLALQADLLAAAALGIHNIMAVTGVDPSFGDHHRARSVNDVDLLELLEAIKQLQNGRDMAGVELKGNPTFCVGSLVNSGASGSLLDLELADPALDDVDLGGHRVDLERATPPTHERVAQDRAAGDACYWIAVRSRRSRREVFERLKLHAPKHHRVSLAVRQVIDGVHLCLKRPALSRTRGGVVPVKRDSESHELRSGPGNRHGRRATTRRCHE